MREHVSRLVDALALRRSLARLETGLSERDTVPLALFLGSLAVYWTIGELIADFHGFNFFDWFFNADCPRVVADLTRAHKEAAAEAAVSAAHPLFLILLNPIGSSMSRALGRSDLIGALVVCHVGAAFANVVFYWTLRRLGLRRVLAASGALVFAWSTTELVFGSIVETYAFVALATMGCVLVSLVTTRPERAALVHVVPFGLNVALGPYSLLAAPVLWLGRLSPKKWLMRTAVFWVLVTALTVGLLKAQHDRYPDTNFFHKELLEGYFKNYSDHPSGKERIFRRWGRVVPHLFAFDVVAPMPLFTGKPTKITTFMLEGQNKVARYSPFGWLVATAWAAAFLAGTAANFRALVRDDRERLGVRLLCLGWFFGVFCLFTVFGDDLLLYSALWVGHVVLWTFLGLERYATGRHARVVQWGTFAFLVALAGNNLAFVSHMLGFYR